MNVKEFGEFKNMVKKGADGTEVSESTRSHYRGRLSKFCDFHGMNPHQLIEEAYYSEAEEGEAPWLKRNPGEERITKYYQHLITPERKGGEGLSENTASTYFRILKTFYEKNNVKVELKAPTAPKANDIPDDLDRFDVRKLVYTAANPRDQAVILVAFQSGMKTQEICRLDYKQYKEGKNLMEKHGFNCLPIRKIRKKTKIKHTTFLGGDACGVLETYLDDRSRKEGRINGESPLFIKERCSSPERIEPRHIQKMMRRTAEKAGFEQEKGKINPISIKNLRDAFSSILKSKGANDVMIEHWMGHAPPYKGAYHNLRLADMATEYEEYQHHLSITGPEERTDRRIEDLHAKLGERDERIDNLEEQIRELRSKVESIDRFGRLLDSSGEMEELKETIEKSVERALLEKKE